MIRTSPISVSVPSAAAENLDRPEVRRFRDSKRRLPDESLADLYIALSRPHQSLGLHITDTCPIRCRHCWTESGPERRERMDAELAAAAVRQAGESGEVRVILISGGEPFAALPVLRSALAAAESQPRLSTLVVTNAFWAKTPDAAAKMLGRLPKIDFLDVSIDPFHEEFLPRTSVRNALEAALAAGSTPILSICAWGGREDPYMAEIEAFLGPELSSRVEFSCNQIEKNGRAESLTHPGPRKWKRELPDRPCDRANRPVMMPDGEVVACCNTAVAIRPESKPLRHGNLADRSFAEISADAKRDVLVEAIRVLGPKHLAEELRERGFADRFDKFYREGDICALCADLFATSEQRAALNEIAADPEFQARVELGRFLLDRIYDASDGID